MSPYPIRAIGPKQLRKAIDRLNMSGDAAMARDAEISENSYAHAMEDEDFTVDQSLMGASALDSTYCAALTSCLDGNSGTKTSGAGDESDESERDESSHEEGYSVVPVEAEAEALHNKSALTRELMAVEEMSSHVRVETALRCDAYLRLTSTEHQSHPFPFAEFLYKCTKKRTVKTTYHDVSMPLRSPCTKVKLYLVGRHAGAISLANSVTISYSSLASL